MISIDKMLMLTQGQGHKVKGQGQICNFVKMCLGYISWTNDCTLMMHIHMISIDKMLKLYQGQGHKVKGQGQICSFLKKTCLPINHERIVGSLWYLHIWMVLLRQKSWPKVKVTRSKVKVKYAIL